MKKITAIMMLVVLTIIGGCVISSPVMAENRISAYEWNEAVLSSAPNEASIIAIVITGVVGVYVASALLPDVFWQQKGLAANLTTEGYTSEANIVDRWGLFIVIGILFGVIGFAL